MPTVTITAADAEVRVLSPYHPGFIAFARDRNAKFKGGAWCFDARDRPAVEAACRATYGTAGEETPTATVLVALDHVAVPRTLYLCGRQVVDRPGRDDRVRLGAGVVVIAGGFPSSGGSVKNPHPSPFGGTILEVRDVPRALAEAECRVHPEALTLLDPAADQAGPVAVAAPVEPPVDAAAVRGLDDDAARGPRAGLPAGAQPAEERGGAPMSDGRRWVYHYTGTRQLRQIVREGVIKAGPTRLWRDFERTVVARDTEPIVWLSSNPMLEMTTAIKLGFAGLVGNVGRIALPYGYAGDVGLGEYTERVGIPHDDWLWCVHTGELAGSNYTTWRVVPHDVPRCDWHHAEWLSSLDEDGFVWEEWPLPAPIPDPSA